MTYSYEGPATCVRSLHSAIDIGQMSGKLTAVKGESMLFVGKHDDVLTHHLTHVQTSTIKWCRRIFGHVVVHTASGSYYVFKDGSAPDNI